MGDLMSLTGCSVFAMLLRVYVDDSSDEKQEKVVVAGAFVGTAKQWSGLKLQWQRRLKKDGLRYFRSTEYYSLRGEFARYRDPVKYPKPEGGDAATALRNDLDGIIKKSGVMGMAVAIPMKVYNHVRETEFGAKEIFSSDAFESALQSLINQCAKTSQEEFRGIPLAFVCDDGPSSARIAKTYSEFKALNTHVSQYLGALVHQDDKHFPQLQAADLMAHLAKETYLRQLENPILDGTPPRLEHSVHRIDSWTEEVMKSVLSAERKKLWTPLKVNKKGNT